MKLKYLNIWLARNAPHKLTVEEYKEVIDEALNRLLYPVYNPVEDTIINKPGISVK